MGSICIIIKNKPYDELIFFEQILILIEEEEKEIDRLLPKSKILFLKQIYFRS